MGKQAIRGSIAMLIKASKISTSSNTLSKKKIIPSASSRTSVPSAVKTKSKYGSFAVALHRTLKNNTNGTYGFLEDSNGFYIYHNARQQITDDVVKTGLRAKHSWDTFQRNMTNYGFRQCRARRTKEYCAWTSTRGCFTPSSDASAIKRRGVAATDASGADRRATSTTDEGCTRSG